jgi:hypothetical protein
VAVLNRRVQAHLKGCVLGKRHKGSCFMGTMHKAGVTGFARCGAAARDGARRTMRDDGVTCRPCIEITARLRADAKARAPAGTVTPRKDSHAGASK